jgi:hypothetical protein
MRRRNRYSTIWVFCILAISLIIVSSTAYADRADVEAFVTRFYQQCLGRNPDLAGLNNWVDALINGSLAGDDVGYGFIFSQEFIDQNTSNEEFVTILYQAFFNREPDSMGYLAWLNLLYSQQIQSGEEVARATVLDGFLGSQEFLNLCSAYGINSTSSPSCQTVSGDWYVTFFSARADCGRQNYFGGQSLYITQDGCTGYTYDFEGRPVTGTISGNQMTFSLSYVAEEGVTASRSGTLIFFGNTAFGVGQTEYFDGDIICTSTDRYAATRQ